MNVGLAIMGSLGGLTAFVTAVVVLVRGIFRMIEATRINTTSTDKLTSAINDICSRLNEQERIIAILQDRTSRNGSSGGTKVTL